MAFVWVAFFRRVLTRFGSPFGFEGNVPDGTPSLIARAALGRFQGDSPVASQRKWPSRRREADVARGTLQADLSRDQFGGAEPLGRLISSRRLRSVPCGTFRK